MNNWIFCVSMTHDIKHKQCSLFNSTNCFINKLFSLIRLLLHWLQNTGFNNISIECVTYHRMIRQINLKIFTEFLVLKLVMQLWLINKIRDKLSILNYIFIAFLQHIIAAHILSFVISTYPRVPICLNIELLSINNECLALRWTFY